MKGVCSCKIFHVNISKTVRVKTLSMVNNNNITQGKAPSSRFSFKGALLQKAVILAFFRHISIGNSKEKNK